MARRWGVTRRPWARSALTGSRGMAGKRSCAMISDLLAPRTLSYLDHQRSPRDAADLLERYAPERRPGDREALLARFAPLVRRLAQRYQSGSERDDVLQIAYIGLLNAIERYDPGRGLAFSSFAMPTILGEIKRYFRDQGWSVRAPREVQELALRAD